MTKARASFVGVVADLEERVVHRDDFDLPGIRYKWRGRLKRWIRSKLRKWGGAKDGWVEVWQCDRHAIGRVIPACVICLDEQLEVQHLATGDPEMSAARFRDLEAASVRWRDRALKAEGKVMRRRRLA